MTEGLAPITEDDIDWLDEFLLNRISDNENTEGMDEGIFSVAELDGFFAALVSGPVSVPQSQWVEAVWGDYPPEWESEEEAHDVVELMTRIMNSVEISLADHPDEFEAIFLEHEVDGKTYTIVDEWCEGYMRGVALSLDAWEAGGEQVRDLLEPIDAFTENTNWTGHDLSQKELERLQKSITPNVRAIYQFWAERRSQSERAGMAPRTQPSRVGRNDPCPCGSGKKYKNCCLQ